MIQDTKTFLLPIMFGTLSHTTHNTNGYVSLFFLVLMIISLILTVLTIVRFLVNLRRNKGM